MAMIIRDRHRLLTVRINLRPSRSGAQLTFTSFHGKEELERHELPAKLAGIVPELSIQAYRGAHFHVPEDVIQPLAASLRDRAEPDEPMWLQVGASAGHLAVVPWERLLQPALRAPLLRVPNFLADPVFLTGRLRLALVVSSPRAKTPFDVNGYARSLARIVQEAVPHGAEIHVFADWEAYPSLAELQPSVAQHTLVVHDPSAAASYGTGGTHLPSSWARDRLESPWLRWIEGATRGLSIDAVHFMCPGFFRGEQGALALARSPGVNEDREWSHFVSAPELIAFLDLVGAWTVAFSPPYENVWAIGLRLLADRIAWQRPGALLLHNTEHGSYEDLGRAYAFLFQQVEVSPPVSPNLMLYSHPRRMQRYREKVSFEGDVSLGYGKIGHETVPEQLAMLAAKEDRSERASAKAEDPAWEQANRIQLDEMLLRLGKKDTPTRRGALDALERVDRILRSTKS